MSLGTSFGTAAAEYEAGRPGYPADAVAWLLAGVTSPVADVGAGTGKLTAEISRQGFDVTAVDPDPAMLAALAGVLPSVPFAVGTGESLPFADASLGALTFGQSWHWVEVAAASAEAARVLVPGGVLGLVWNIRDDRVGWVEAIGAAMGSSKAESMMRAEEVRADAPFGDLEQLTVEWELPVTLASLRSMVRSRSYYIAGTPAARAAIDAGVEEVLATLDPEGLTLPYVTHAFRATRP